MSSTWINQLWKGIYISAKKLLHTSVIEDVTYDRTLAFKALQHLFTCNILSCLCLLRLIHNLQLAKEDVTDLFWA